MIHEPTNRAIITSIHLLLHVLVMPVFYERQTCISNNKSKGTHMYSAVQMLENIYVNLVG